MNPYCVLRKELIFHDGVILRKQELVIPPCLRRSFLRLAHEGHIGIVKCKARLRSKVWWPHIDSEVSSFISECRSCQTMLDHHHVMLCYVMLCYVFFILIWRVMALYKNIQPN